jgi:hypothetical protein
MISHRQAKLQEYKIVWPDDGWSVLAEMCSLVLNEHNVVFTDCDIRLYFILQRGCATVN